MGLSREAAVCDSRMACLWRLQEASLGRSRRQRGPLAPERCSQASQRRQGTAVGARPSEKTRFRRVARRPRAALTTGLCGAQGSPPPPPPPPPAPCERRQQRESTNHAHLRRVRGNCRAAGVSWANTPAAAPLVRSPVRSYRRKPHKLSARQLPVGADSSHSPSASVSPPGADFISRHQQWTHAPGASQLPVFSTEPGELPAGLSAPSQR